MLKEVSSSIGLIGFSTRSGIDVNTDGASGSVGVVFGSDGKAIRQLFERDGQFIINFQWQKAN